MQQNYQQRVLIVDADPQCSATIYLFNQGRLNEFYKKTEAPSIYRVVQHLRKVKGGYIKEKDIPIQTDSLFGVDVLIGDTCLALAEDFLSKDWSDATNGESRGLMTTFVFRGLLEELQNKYDYVFFDMGPSLGAINRTVLLACDYFIVPMSSDIFCLRAIENISLSLKSWLKGVNGGLEKYKENEGECYLSSPISLSFLGYITQQYNARIQGGVKRPVKAYDKIIEKFENEIFTKLKDFYSPERQGELKLGEVPNWNSLVAFSQTANKPIFNLISGDGVFGSHIQKVKEFALLMDKITSKILKNS